MDKNVFVQKDRVVDGKKIIFYFFHNAKGTGKWDKMNYYVEREDEVDLNGG